MGEVQDREVVRVNSIRSQDSSKERIQDLEDQRVDKEGRVINNRTPISRDNKDHHYLTARFVVRSILGCVIKLT